MSLDDSYCSDGVRVSAPGKVILHGEHSVVYGKTALACSIDLRTTTHIKPATNIRQIKLNFPDLGGNHVITLQSLKSMLKQIHALDGEMDSNLVGTIVNIIQDEMPGANDETGLIVFLYLYLTMSVNLSATTLLPMDVTVRSDIPIGAGLGSSAAFSVSLAGAIFYFVKKSLGSNLCLSRLNGNTSHFKSNVEDSDAICQWAYNAEKIIHGNPSGLDNSICTFGGLLSYKKNPSLFSTVPDGITLGNQDTKQFNKNIIENIAVPRNLRILLINTKVARNTKALVSKVGKDRMALFPKLTTHILDAMDKVSHECKDTLAAVLHNSVQQNNNNKLNNCEDQEKLQFLFHKLEQLIDINHGLLSALGVSHPTLEQIKSICLEKGQLHAKLTGAGGGGFAFALVTPFHEDTQVFAAKAELEKEGFQCWDTNIAANGLVVHNP